MKKSLGFILIPLVFSIILGSIITQFAFGDYQSGSKDVYQAKKDTECRKGLTLLYLPSKDKYYCADDKSAEGFMQQGAIAIKGDYVTELNLMYGANLDAEQNKEEINVMVSPAYKPPKKQHKEGVEFHKIQCNDGLHLIVRYSGHPACVKLDTHGELVERGWGTHPPEISDTDKYLKDAGLIVEIVDYTKITVDGISKYQVNFRIDTGGRSVKALQLIVESDSDSVKVQIGSIRSGEKIKKSVVIAADDPETITAKIDSFSFKKKTYSG